MDVIGGVARARLRVDLVPIVAGPGSLASGC